jgi:hypothetical protein
VTEQERKSIRPLSKEEEAVIEALHFVLSFFELQQETKFSAATLRQILQTLMRDGLVQILAWSDGSADLVALESLPPSLESCSFLATKAGLFSFHSS